MSEVLEVGRADLELWTLGWAGVTEMGGSARQALALSSWN